MIPPSPADVPRSDQARPVQGITSRSDGRLERVQELERYVAREVELLQELSDSRDISTRNQPPRSKRAGERFLPNASQIRTTAAAISGSEIEAFKQHSETVKAKARQSSITFLALASLTASSWPGLLPTLSPYAGERRAMDQLRHSEER